MNCLHFLPLLFIINSGISQDLPFHVDENMFDQSQPETLGLEKAKGTETITIFSPSDSTAKFSNGVVMTAFKDKLYCQWQSSVRDEDSNDSWVAYSVSNDGIEWSAPTILARTIPEGYSSSGGWWVYRDTLIAYINTWPEHTTPRGGYTRYTVSTDGINWSEPDIVTMQNGDTLLAIFEQDPKALPGGRIINAAHFQPGLIVNPIFTDDPKGITGWTKAAFTNLDSGDVSRCIEPSSFLNKDREIIMTFRDQKSSFLKIASISKDNGETWSKPVFTSMPDARTKQSAGNFSDGAAYLAGNPVNNKIRLPLVVTLSNDGEFFRKSWLLRNGKTELQPLRYEGKSKRPGYHYPKSMVYNGFLYVCYATNKEDVEYTRVPVSSLFE